MRDTLTRRDWETISAYLDGQLSARKQARLESRLQQDQQLQVALEEMGNTRKVLRNAPRLRAPRSFLLTPEMAGQPRRLPRLAPVFGWASAVASFLFVIFLVGDLFTTGGAIPMALNNFPQQQQEFVAPKGVTAEDNIASEQPSDTGGMSDAAQPMSESPASEIPDEGTTFGSAASPEESAPIAEPAASRQIEPAEATAEPAVEQPASENPVEDETTEAEVIAEAASTQESFDASVTSGATTEDVTEEHGAREVDQVVEPTESHESREGEGDLVQMASITETSPTETALAEELKAPLAEEPQPTERTAPTTALPQPTSEATGDEVAVAPEPTAESDWGFAAAEASEKSSNYVIGAEVILGLFAVGTALAWLYLRRRGG